MSVNRINQIKEALSILDQLHTLSIREDVLLCLQKEIVNQLVSNVDELQPEITAPPPSANQDTTNDYELPPLGVEELPSNHPFRVLLSTRIGQLGYPTTRSNITKVCGKMVDAYLHQHKHYPPREMSAAGYRLRYVYLTRDIPLMDSVIHTALGSNYNS